MIMLILYKYRMQNIWLCNKFVEKGLEIEIEYNILQYTVQYTSCTDERESILFQKTRSKIENHSKKEC